MKKVIVSNLKDCNFSLVEFDHSANAVPSLVSLICRLRKFYEHGQKVANRLDVLHADYVEEFKNATVIFYQL